MAVLRLSSVGRRTLEAIVARPKDVRQYRRAQALLWLDEGERPATIAQRLRVHRDTIYAWATRYWERAPQRVPARLMDGARTGRPRRLAERVEQVLVAVLEMEPHTQGYRAAQWTTPLLCQYLREHQALGVSEVTVRRCLHRLGYRWKRPRYVLARRSRHWRQAKGGSSAAYRIDIGRSSSCWMRPSFWRRPPYAPAGPKSVFKRRFPSPATMPDGSSTVRSTSQAAMSNS
jgi:transposase